MTYEYDQFDNGQLCAYEHALNIIQDLNKKLKDPETILDKAKAKIKQQIQSVHNNYSVEDAPALYNEEACEDLTTSLGDLLDE